MLLKISSETQNCDRYEMPETDHQLQDLQRKRSWADFVPPESASLFQVYGRVERKETGNGS